jgi:hypothetical protein
MKNRVGGENHRLMSEEKWKRLLRRDQLGEFGWLLTEIYLEWFGFVIFTRC